MTESEYRKQLKEFEGYETHMYLDSKGYVTIGIGIMFANAQAAKKSGISFTNRATKAKATDDEIAADYDLTKKKKPTKLDADEGDLKKRLDKELKQAESDAKAYYSDFSNLPSSIQFALIDLAFNTGATGLSKFKLLKKALENKDWEEAAKQSHRKDIQASRNKAIADWIRAGAKEK